MNDIKRLVLFFYRLYLFSLLVMLSFIIISVGFNGAELTIENVIGLPIVFGLITGLAALNSYYTKYSDKELLLLGLRIGQVCYIATLLFLLTLLFGVNFFVEDRQKAGWGALGATIMLLWFLGGGIVPFFDAGRVSKKLKQQMSDSVMVESDE